MDPGPSRRRLMEAGETIDAAFSLYRHNAALFAGVLAVVLIPQAILDVIAPALTALSVITNTAGLGALVVAVSARHTGHEITIGEAYSALVTSRFMTLVATYVVYVVVVTLGLVLAIVPGIYFMVRFAFFAPAVVLEQRGIGGALSRSSDLVRGHWGRVFGVGLLVFILSVVVEGLLSAVFGVSHSPRAANALAVIAGLLVQPVAVSALVLLYYDLRLRKEGPIGTPSMAGVP